MVLLGSILGFLGSALPDVLKLWQDSKDKKHELDILQLQMELQAQGHNARLEEINAQADIQESKGLYRTYKTGIHWVDALNGTVRPVLAYSFFLLYAAVKISLIVSALSIEGSNITEAIISVWGDTDQAIFAAIISFYYGKRSLDRVMGRMR